MRYITFDSEFLSDRAISSRISFSNAYTEDQTVTLCLSLASCQILQLLDQMFSCTRAARFRFQDILATKEERKNSRFKRDDCIIELLLVMASREEEAMGMGREPPSPRKGKGRKGLQEIRQGYVQITERLTSKVKKPLQDLKAMMEAELQRIRQE